MTYPNPQVEAETPSDTSGERRAPPGPSGHWLFGTMPRWRSEPLSYMVEATEQYGDAIRFRFMPRLHGYLFSHPEHNKHILLDNNRNYTKIPHPSFLTLQPLLGNGLLTNDGTSWLNQRRLIQPVFHRRRIARFGQIMTDCTWQMIERWRATLSNGTVQLDVDYEMTQLTLEIVGKALFGLDLTDLSDAIGEVFTEVNRQLAELTAVPFGWLLLRYPFTPSARRVTQNIDRLKNIVDRIIERRRNTPGTREDLLSMLIEAEDQETGERMTNRQLRDEVMTLLLAGHETTANTLSWTFYLLAEHPSVLGKLHSELADVLGGSRPTIANLPNLPYSTMILKESLRLYPPAYVIGRWAVARDTVTGYEIKKGSSVNLSPYLTHRNPDFWPDPNSFDPQRFAPAVEAERPKFAYIPFGGGPRQCIGNNFAMTEAQLILAMVAQSFELELGQSAPVQIEPMITLRPKGGLPMMIRARDGKVQWQAAR